MEGEGERTLEHARGSGELALGPEGAEPVEGISADLGLDSLGAQLGQHPVAVVQLEHVGLPAVDVAVVGLGQ